MVTAQAAAVESEPLDLVADRLMLLDPDLEDLFESVDEILATALARRRTTTAAPVPIPSAPDPSRRSGPWVAPVARGRAPEPPRPSQRGPPAPGSSRRPNR
ncbi:hypothetical protein CJ469_04830 [Nocardia farcinica]|uniref:hypothetical protein n=1 Tax=Nocardia farcinica TaxID=37329 RepID=UPI000BF6BE7F|nr:hypothetical protein [Nocardia farcinica]PFX00047.1 hypothetical protein CJ469_04830 [Nocardia farcinica]PFX05964.1 hypothetical protein CJ468_05071 [Nocardia farcinica]